MSDLRRLGERLIGGPARLLLLPGWLALRPAVALRGLLYDRGLRPRHRLPAPVVSVGNLTLGGTGKTPVARLVVDLLAGLGRRPVVLSRGYGGGGHANDEARAMGCAVVCDPDRVAGGRRALAEGADCLVLDDGFQHRRLHRDLDLVCIDALRPWGEAGGGRGAVFPLGRLREPPAALARASALVVTRWNDAEASPRRRLLDRLCRFGLPLLRCDHQPTVLRAGDGTTASPATLAGRRVLLASGIGHPQAFAATLRTLGALVAGHRIFPDHHPYTAAEARDLVRQARSTGTVLVVTAKDAVKLFPLLAADDPVRSLEVAATLVEDDRRRLLDLLTGILPPR